MKKRLDQDIRQTPVDSPVDPVRSGSPIQPVRPARNLILPTTRERSARRNRAFSLGSLSMKLWPIVVAVLLMLSTAGTSLLTSTPSDLDQPSEPPVTERTVTIILSPTDADLDTYNVLYRGNGNEPILTQRTTRPEPSSTQATTVATTVVLLADSDTPDDPEPVDVIAGAQPVKDPAHGILENQQKPLFESDPSNEPTAQTDEPASTDPQADPAPPTVDANGVTLEQLPVDQFKAVNEKWYVRVSLARVRHEPISTAETVAKVAYGDVVTVISQGSAWSSIMLDNGKTGFILSELVTAETIVKPTPAPTLAPTPTPTPAPTPAPAPTVDANGVPLEQLSPDQFKAVNEKRYVQVSVARVRREPISTAETVAKVVYGDVVTVIGQGSAWSSVSLADGKTGFIFSDLLTAETIVKPTPTLAPTPTVVPTTPPTPPPTEPSAASPTPTAEPTSAPTPAPTPTSAPAPTSGGLTPEQEEQMIALAKSALGVDYVYGGSSMSGFDCSGFTRYIYLTMFNIKLPHSAKDQCLYSGIALEEPFSLAQMRVGDIICFDWSSPYGVCDHVGLYIGNGQYIHASYSRDEVVESTLNLSRNPIIAIKRIIY